jgi:3-oxoadipate enol-lactonase
MPKFKSGNLSLFYEEYNKDGIDTIVFVHPAPLDRTAWIYQVPYFSQYFHVITLDQRCFGLSDKPDFQFDISEYGHDLQALFRELGIWNVYLVGLSLGGIAAQFLALLEPSRIKSLILADTLSATKDSSMIMERVKRFGSEGIEGYYEEAVKSLCSKTFLASKIGNYFLRLFVEKSKNLSNASIMRCYEALAKLDITSKLTSIQIPTLVIAGTEDYAFQDSKIIAESIPNADFVSLDGLGHVTQLEDPNLFNSVVFEFIKNNRSAV